MNVIFFTAPWCGACKGIKPHVISACNDARVPLAFVDTDEDAELSIRRGVSSLPTIIIEHNGVELDRITGAVGKNEMAKRLNDARRE